MVERLTVRQAATLLGVPEQFIRLGLQQNRFPWGYAVKGKGEYTYFINKGKLEQIEGVKDEQEQDDLDDIVDGCASNNSFDHATRH